MRDVLIVIAVGVGIVTIILGFALKERVAPEPVVKPPTVTTPGEPTPTDSTKPVNESSPAPQAESSLVEPVSNFKARITKKPFGIHITPQGSPVQPERFNGYHTGSDAEFTDVNEEVPVRAIAAGSVVSSRTVDGYGGVMVITHNISNQNYVAIYGHLDPKSLRPTGTNLTAGDQIGVLGEGGTNETDGERKHLHLALVKSQTPDLRGYVTTQAELSAWTDPATFY